MSLMHPAGMSGLMDEDAGGKRPRGKMTPYACFVKVIRAEHKKKHPSECIVFSEFSKKCAEKWRQMTEKEKRRFQEMSEKDKERFNREMSSYRPAGPLKMDGMKMGGGPGKVSRKRKRQKDPNAPKRALSAFMWFCKAERPHVKDANPQLKMGQIAKVLSEQWKICPNKHVYEGQAESDKKRYAEQMDVWKKTAPVAGARSYSDGMFYEKHESHHHHSHHSKQTRDPDMPKRPLSAFMWFCKQERPAVRDANPDLKVGQIAQILSEHWKACTNKEKFEEEANRDKRRYAEEVKIYKANKKAAAASQASSSNPNSASMNMGGMVPHPAMAMSSSMPMPHQQQPHMGGMVPQAPMGMMPTPGSAMIQQQMAAAAGLHQLQHQANPYHNMGQPMPMAKQPQMGDQSSSGSEESGSESDSEEDDDEESD